MAKRKAKENTVSETTATTLEIREFKPGQVIVDPRISARRKVEDKPTGAGFDELCESIKREGQLQPGRVWERKNEEDGSTDYVVVYGYHRMRACEALDIPFRAEVKRYSSEQEARLDAIHENKDRTDASVIDDAWNMKQLVDSGMSQKQVAEHYGITSGRVSQLLSILRLPDVVVNSISAGILSVGSGEYLAKFKRALEQADKKLKPSERMGAEKIATAIESLMESCKRVLPSAADDCIGERVEYDAGKLIKKVELACESLQPKEATGEGEPSELGEGTGEGAATGEETASVKYLPSRALVGALSDLIQHCQPGEVWNTLDAVTKFAKKEIDAPTLAGLLGITLPEPVAEEKPAE